MLSSTNNESLTNLRIKERSTNYEFFTNLRIKTFVYSYRLVNSLMSQLDISAIKKLEIERLSLSPLMPTQNAKLLI